MRMNGDILCIKEFYNLGYEYKEKRNMVYFGNSIVCYFILVYCMMKRLSLIRGYQYIDWTTLKPHTFLYELFYLFIKISCIFIGVILYFCLKPHAFLYELFYVFVYKLISSILNLLLAPIVLYWRLFDEALRHGEEKELTNTIVQKIIWWSIETWRGK